MTFLHQNLKIAFKKKRLGDKKRVKLRVIFIYLLLLLTVSHRRKRYGPVPIFSEPGKYWVKRQLDNIITDTL